MPFERWRAGESQRGQYAPFGKRSPNLLRAADAVERVKTGEVRRCEEGDQDGTRASVEGRVAAAGLTPPPERLRQGADDAAPERR